MTRPARLVLTAGEPAGIGPDLCVLLAGARENADITIVADPRVLEARARMLGVAFELDVIDAGATPAGGERPGVIPLHYPNPDCRGIPDPANSAEQLRGLALAADRTNAGEFDALVTAPLHKAAINDAGIAFSGHTEFLAAHLGADQPVMLLTSGELRVALATTHLPLRAVADAITRELLTAVLTVLHDGLTARYSIERPRIVVCGLNPHAGEGGYLGREDATVVAPAVEELRASGMDLIGPSPADTAFTGVAGRADAVLALYHDQGLPVIKHASFGRAVNVTLGLPIVRTSVDHGTALALAGSGDIDTGSLNAAIAEALKLARP
ncbi:MAG: 4-hydroxythreonine-4-phosphate dehydrogenase PdxA [Pseudomonadota bacterium]